MDVFQQHKSFTFVNTFDFTHLGTLGCVCCDRVLWSGLNHGYNTATFWFFLASSCVIIMLGQPCGWFLFSINGFPFCHVFTTLVDIMARLKCFQSQSSFASLGQCIKWGPARNIKVMVARKSTQQRAQQDDRTRQICGTGGRGRRHSRHSCKSCRPDVMRRKDCETQPPSTSQGSLP